MVRLDLVLSLDIQGFPAKKTPVLSIPLVKDENGEEPDSTFNHSSVVGMLQYLQIILDPILLMLEANVPNLSIVLVNLMKRP
jgi:hypothetical protein